jgi:hypothetical protein
MIEMMMADISYSQNEVSIHGELYWGILLGALIASFLWYLIVFGHKQYNDNKLTC